MVCANVCLELAQLSANFYLELALERVQLSVLNWHYCVSYLMSRIGTIVCAVFCLELTLLCVLNSV